jgi:hypothetical protein
MIPYSPDEIFGVLEKVEERGCYDDMFESVNYNIILYKGIQG